MPKGHSVKPLKKHKTYESDKSIPPQRRSHGTL